MYYRKKGEQSQKNNEIMPKKKPSVLKKNFFKEINFLFIYTS